MEGVEGNCICPSLKLFLEGDRFIKVFLRIILQNENFGDNIQGFN